MSGVDRPADVSFFRGVVTDLLESEKQPAGGEIEIAVHSDAVAALAAGTRSPSLSSPCDPPFGTRRRY